MLWDYLTCAHRQFCQYHLTLNICCHLASFCCLKWTLTLSWMQLFFSPWECHPYHALELLGLDYTVPNRCHYFDWHSVAFKSWTSWLSTNVITVMCLFKKHCQFFTWKECIDWLIDGKLSINQWVDSVHIFF